MSTAIDLSKEQLKRYAETARQRQSNREFSLSEQVTYQKLMGRIEQAAQALRLRFGATRVVLFGSLAHLAWYRSGSDVDLAVEGIPAQDYFPAWGVVEDIIGDRLVDLVDLQDASPALREAIDKYGKDFVNQAYYFLAERIRGEVTEIEHVVNRALRSWDQARKNIPDQDIFLDRWV